MGSLTPHAIADIAVPFTREYGVDELYLFGSMARGTQTERSDVDFIYNLPDAPDNYRKIIDFRHQLSSSSADQWISFENPMWKIPRLMRIRSTFVVRSCTISSNIQSIEFCKGAELNEMRR